MRINQLKKVGKTKKRLFVSITGGSK